MKQAVSISMGSSNRDKHVEIDLDGERISIRRIGTDGDMQRAAELFRELDGKVDAFGVGGADLGLQIDDRWYPLHSVQPMVRYVRQTPIVDGTGLKNTLEARVAAALEESLIDPPTPRRTLITSGADRWGMTISFVQAGYECVFGDLMFALGLPIPLRSTDSIKRMAAIMMPIVSRLPFKWLYPTGEAQDQRTPKWEGYYRWASVIAGDCHYVKRYMPASLDGKIIVTNTTTESDVEMFREAGISHLLTTTPVVDGRSFGTNMMEAALVARAGMGRPLRIAELQDWLKRVGFEPRVLRLGGHS
ncbi:MAG: hypothetical protein R3191_03480 [Anaerolineales bacterium]|nr:hypothetical protein [Anaerolineales bacterium]